MAGGIRLAIASRRRTAFLLPHPPLEYAVMCMQAMDSELWLRMPRVCEQGWADGGR